ncbi:MAG: DUF1846 domain-containing protein [Candidatus Edwardsbacteria bacterium]|nr:DUF1846 domain-containing protein [Candidatus Edwardsbacteria bacterium]
MQIGFDNDKYLREQTAAIRERVAKFGNKLYLEFGGKLIYDYHAARVLPGFHPNVKMQLLQQLRDQADILLCIYAGDIERRKIRADFGITYDVDAMKLIDDLKVNGLSVTAVVITRFDNQPAATIFKNKLEHRCLTVHTHRYTRGYPTDVDTVVSDEGYGANQYVATSKPLVVVTGPGPGSGKLATCLSQMYHDHRRGVRSGYAKFETFPIWNIPLKHPVNVAYEAATADIRDCNLIDPFHLEAYGQTAVNYNRDVEVFPVLRRILVRIMGDSLYKSPTDMGVNCAGFGIVDDQAVQEAARQELIRRYFRYRCEHVMGFVDKDTIQRVELLMDDLGITPEDRPVVEPARRAAAEGQGRGKGNEGIFCGTAIQLPDGSIIAGKNSAQMHAASSLVLNAVKQLAGIPDRIHLLSPAIIESIANLDRTVLKEKSVSLDLEETLIALAVSAMTNPTAQMAMEHLKILQGCEVHSTHIPTPGDEEGLRKLGVNLTSDPNFSSHSLFVA